MITSKKLKDGVVTVGMMVVVVMFTALQLAVAIPVLAYVGIQVLRGVDFEREEDVYGW